MLDLPLALTLSASLLLSERAVAGGPLLPAEERRSGRVCAIIPARNEVGKIERSAGTLLDAVARYGDARLIVVDDGSTDGTGARLDALEREQPHAERLARLRLDEALPEGWMGKPRACWAGAQSTEARAAEWLLFMDADTAATPALIGRLVAAAEREGAALVTLFPYQELVSVAERLTMPHIFYVLGAFFPWRRVNDPASPVAIANGQCFLVRRAAYDAVGGHAAVRGEIAEDQALAQRLKAAGHHLYVADGRDAMRTRMYESFGELWEGWTKNAYLGLGDRGWLLGVVALLGIVLGVWPFVALPLRIAQRRPREAAAWALTVAILQRNRVRLMDEMSLPRRYALATPLSALLCTAIAVGAWWKIASGVGVTWKGRRYGRRA